MVRSELLKRSPVKALQSSLHGGPGKGNLGAVVARKGVGKTAFLVHLATYELLQEKHVIHVSFSARTDHIIAWYEEIFAGVAARFDLEGAMAVHDDIIRRRVIMNFNQAGPSVDRIARSLHAMIGEGHFRADLVVVDGYDFGRSSLAEIQTFRDFARDMHLEMWFSVSVPSLEQTEAFDANRECFATIISMRADEGRITLKLEKDHDETPNRELDLTLDPRTLLISE